MGVVVSFRDLAGGYQPVPNRSFRSVMLIYDRRGSEKLAGVGKVGLVAIGYRQYTFV